MRDYKTPFDKDAEASVLGAMIIDPSSIPLVKGGLLSAHFYHLPHQFIYKTLIEMHNIGIAIDIVTLKDELIKRELLEKVGGLEQVVAIIERVPTAGNIRFYAQIIKEKFTKRQHLLLANKMSEAVLNNKPTSELNSISKELEKLRDGLGEPANISLLLESAIEDMKRSEQGYEMTTGIGEIDGYILGLSRGKLYIIAGETSHGKTAFALNIVLANLERNIKVYYYTYDMSAKYIILRLTGLAGHIPLSKITKPMLYKVEQDEIRAKMRDIIKKYESTGQLIVRGYVPLSQVESDIASGETGLVIIDYIQTAIASEPMDKAKYSIAWQIGEYIAEIKRIANKYNCCFIVASQFNRANKEQRRAERTLGDLKESSSIEQGADVVLFLDWGYARSEDIEKMNKYDVRIMKNNMGKRGRINLHFEPDIQVFHTPDFDPETYINKERQNVRQD